MRKKQRTSSNRLPEKWFRRGLWLVAFVFAGFLIGLGGKIVGDLPQAAPYKELREYVNHTIYDPLLLKQTHLQDTQTSLQEQSEQASLALEKQRNIRQSEQTSLDNWLATRSATEQSDQNPEVIARTQKLDALKTEERQAQQRSEGIQQQQLDSNQRLAKVNTELAQLDEAAQVLKDADDRKIELRVFLYRLALTLPLLLIATYLFMKQRGSRWWPFVWGFIYFALFAFFVELVPYLPSYGGYVRYIVGIGVTVLVGRYAIVALNRYLERQKQAEQLPDQERRKELSYDVALARLAKSVCPGCERPVDLKNDKIDYCPHCGIGLFDRCGHCSTRKSAFARFCHACGHAAAPTDTPHAHP